MVLVPDAGITLSRLRRRLDRRTAWAVPAHITVLYPFAPPDTITDDTRHRLTSLMAGIAPFAFALSDVGWFDDRVLYLGPSPTAPFVALTEAVAGTFPEHRPYRGAYDAVIPHFTLAEGVRLGRMRRAARRAKRLLPIEARAAEVCLIAPGPGGRWAVTDRFPLGGRSGRRPAKTRLTPVISPLGKLGGIVGKVGIHTRATVDPVVPEEAPAVALAPGSVVAERVRQFIKRHDGLMGGPRPSGVWLTPCPGPWAPASRPSSGACCATGWAELVLIMDAFEADGIPYWLAGGWGIDALLGRRTRRHRDVDIVIGDFEVYEPKARRVLMRLGFAHVNMDMGGVWMPSRSNFGDEAGHRVELLGVDWEHLRAVMAMDPAHGHEPPSSADELAAQVFTIGAVDGRNVPCLTGPAQELFHTGFPLEPAAQADIDLLRASVPPPA